MFRGCIAKRNDLGSINAILQYALYRQRNCEYKSTYGVTYGEIAQLVDGTDDATSFVAMAAFGAALGPLAAVPLVQTRNGGGARPRVGRLLLHLVVQTFLQRVLSTGRVLAGDISRLFRVVAFLALKSLFKLQTVRQGLRFC
jgi:hypothetical protein